MLEPETTEERAPIASLVSLGCAKNTVDSERILGMLVENGWMIAGDPADADLCLVNTCGFIADARAETKEVLDELCALKETGSLKAVVALGCMVERVADVTENSEVVASADLLVGFRDYPRLPKICRELLAEDAVSTEVREKYPDFLGSPRLQTGYPHHAYLKISEGCSNRCSFCTIPQIRGPQRSRPVEEIVSEAEQLLAGGACEIEIIAQDTTSYGKDLYGKRALPQLLEELAQIETSAWFRLMYVYPRFLTEETMDIMAGDHRFCPYIDIPLQHISNRILSRMGRGMDKGETVGLLDRIEEKIPQVALRTTFIAGYPGETESDFQELLDFVKEGRFMHAGVFTYSHELGTRAAREEDSVPEEEKERRRDLLMQAQARVSQNRLASLLGKTIPVMFDEYAAADAEEGLVGYGHSQWQEIDVDGCIAILDPEHKLEGIEPGAIADLEIVDTLDYDLLARP